MFFGLVYAIFWYPWKWIDASINTIAAASDSSTVKVTVRETTGQVLTLTMNRQARTKRIRLKRKYLYSKNMRTASMHLNYVLFTISTAKAFLILRLNYKLKAFQLFKFRIYKMKRRRRPNNSQILRIKFPNIISSRSFHFLWIFYQS